MGAHRCGDAAIWDLCRNQGAPSSYQSPPPYQQPQDYSSPSSADISLGGRLLHCCSATAVFTYHMEFAAVLSGFCRSTLFVFCRRWRAERGWIWRGRRRRIRRVSRGQRTLEAAHSALCCLHCRHVLQVGMAEMRQWLSMIPKPPWSVRMHAVCMFDIYTCAERAL